ncbi:MAG: cyclic-phosphate processing receiver domain-containing protein [Nanoarchaeota archaeon]
MIKVHNKIKLYVDDVRSAPPGWILAKTITEAIRILACFRVIEISLDHDIAYFDESGIFTGKVSNENFSSVAWFIANIPKKFRPKKVYIHTANPTGAFALNDILKNKVNEIIRVIDYVNEWNNIKGKRK